ncbi:MAG: GNAT family N-acetyltransferase [Methyloceanibacter sp.]|uniref:GNAT family N-acetyltransferase n=1 Tax=Methyloceanibacter sp. TaxID=1965321 RepID=UPI003D6D7567
MATQDVKTATKAEMDQCVALIALAFNSDPAARWLYKDADAFLENFPRLVRILGGAAFDHGSAHIIEGAAAALWMPPGVQPDEEALAALVESTAPASQHTAVFAMFEQMSEAHPQEPHWYLPMIGTDPARQGQGYGSALLSHALSNCDAQGTLAYLEATSPRSARLYQRHGFEPVGTIQAGDGPPITPMLRKPR